MGLCRSSKYLTKKQIIYNGERNKNKKMLTKSLKNILNL